MLITEAARKYVDDVQTQVAIGARRPRTLEAIQHVMRKFCGIVPDKDLAELKRTDVLLYLNTRKGELVPHRQRTVSNRTLANEYVRISAFLTHHGIELPKRERQQDRPRFVQKLPEVYTKGELDRFFKACDPRQLVTFKTLLLSGLRYQEIRWLQWDDIEQAALHVQAHPPEFVPKTHEERRIPLVYELQVLLWQLPHRPGRLIFPTESGKPKKHFIIECKRIARRAGLDESHFWLHKFRATFCTNLLRQGLDIRTVMSLMGHRALSSTMRYLRPLEGDELRAKMNAALAAAA